MPSKSHISSGAASFRKQPLRPLKNPWFWKEPRFLRPSDARNAHEKCCGIRLWGSAPNPGRGMIPLHPALCQQPLSLSKKHFELLEDRDAPGETRIRRHVQAAGNPQSSSCANPGAEHVVRAERRDWLTYASSNRPDKGTAKYVGEKLPASGAEQSRASSGCRSPGGPVRFP